MTTMQIYLKKKDFSRKNHNFHRLHVQTDAILRKAAIRPTPLQS